jgi:hypothetical protein
MPSPLDRTKLAMLVVAESESPCEVPFARLRGLAFLQQERDESSLALSVRLERVVDRVCCDGLVVAHAWLLLNARHDDQRLAARMTVARMLGQAVGRTGGKGLTIVAATDSALGGSSAPVLVLAGAVLDWMDAARITVRVRFVPRPTLASRKGSACMPGLRKAVRRLPAPKSMSTVALDVP